MLLIAPLGALILGTAVERAGLVAGGAVAGSTTVHLGRIDTLGNTEQTAIAATTVRLRRSPGAPVHVVWHEVTGGQSSERRLHYHPAQRRLISGIRGSRVVLNDVPVNALLLAAAREALASVAGVGATARRLRGGGPSTDRPE